MPALRKCSVIMILASLSLSSAWATGVNSFVAEVKSADINGFNVVPPVLTSKTTDDVCLEFTSQPSTTETGEELPFPAANPWRVRVRQPTNEGRGTSNIRLYFGQHFANGRPIATLCDEDISNLCTGSGEPDDDDVTTNLNGRFQLSDIQFQGQQLESMNTLTIADVELEVGEDRLVLPNDDKGLAVMRVLIDEGLIYVVINSNFEASLNEAGEITYTPTTGVIDGDGEIRGTLSLAQDRSECPE